MQVLTSATSFGASAEKDGVDADTARAVAGTIDILLADKADVNVSNKDHRIDATKFSLTVIYDANGKATFETSETQTKALLEVKNEKNPGKNKYWVLNGVK